MHRHDRRPKWKRAVYTGCDGMTSRCQVVLLRMLDGMNANGNVSVPRSKLAADLGVAPARISEAIKLAKSLGFLDTVRRGRPGVTAVYQATLPREQRYAIQDHVHGTDSVPLEPGHLVRMYPTQEVPVTGTVPNSIGADRNVEDHPSTSAKFGSGALAERPPNSGLGATSPQTPTPTPDGNDVDHGEYDVIDRDDVIGDEESEDFG